MEFCRSGTKSERTEAFSSMLKNEEFTDVTLACDDGQCDFKSCDKRHFEIVIDKQRQELKGKKIIFLNWS